VKRTELDELLANGESLRIHHGRIAEDFRAVKDAVSDRVNLLQRLDDTVLGIGDSRHDSLESLCVIGSLYVLYDLLTTGLLVGKAASGDADALDQALAEHLFALHVEEHILERGRSRIDNQNFSYVFFHSFSL